MATITWTFQSSRFSLSLSHFLCTSIHTSHHSSHSTSKNFCNTIVVRIERAKRSSSHSKLSAHQPNKTYYKKFYQIKFITRTECEIGLEDGKKELQPHTYQYTPIKGKEIVIISSKRNYKTATTTKIHHILPTISEKREKNSPTNWPFRRHHECVRKRKATENRRRRKNCDNSSSNSNRRKNSH